MIKNKNQVIGTIEDFDYKGRGITKIDGVPVFLDGGIIGDEVDFFITKEKKNYYNGKINKIIKKSNKRENSPCPYSDKCGGCDFLELKDDVELAWKHDLVKNNINKLGKISLQPKEILSSPENYKYRNNMQFQVKNGIIGLYEKNSRNITKIDYCLMQKDSANKVLNIVSKFKYLKDLKTIGIRTNYKDEIMLILVTNKKNLNLKSIIGDLLEANVKSFYVNYHNKSKTRYSDEFKLIFGEEYLEEKLMDLKFRISPKSFFQVNIPATESLYKKAIEYADIKPEDKIYDLYCGVGSISLCLAKKGAEVIGIEIVSQAVEDARKNAENNKLNCRFIEGAAEEIILKLKEDEHIEPNKIIVDPPRKGLDENLVKFLIDNPVERLIYISCNPSTQARDLNLLKKKYKVEEITPVNLFPNTVHVETIVLMSRK